MKKACEQQQAPTTKGGHNWEGIAQHAVQGCDDPCGIGSPRHVARATTARRRSSRTAQHADKQRATTELR